MSQRKTGRRRLVVSAILLTVLVSDMIARTGALARLQATLDAESPATGKASVIAQGVAEMPSDPIAWRVVNDTAEPIDVAQPVERALGFTAAEPDGIQIADITAGTQTRLAPGEAVFVPEGAIQLRASLNDANANYLRIGLVAEDQRNDPGSDELVFGGEAFAAPSGGRDIDLIRAVLNADDENEIAGGDFPVLIVATGGEILIDTGSGEPAHLSSGEAAEFSGDLVVTGLNDDSSFIAGVIGPEVPKPPRVTGTITVAVFVCAPGIESSDLSDPLDSDQAANCDPAPDGIGASLTDSDGNESSSADAQSDEAGVFTWTALPFGDYTVSEPGDAVDGMTGVALFDGDGNAIGDSPVTIDRDAPDIHVDLFILQGAAGSISITVYNCPDGWTPDNFDPNGCDVASDGFGLTVQAHLPDAPLLTTEDAEQDGNAYVWTGLPLTGEGDGAEPGVFTVDQPTQPPGYTSFASAGEPVDTDSAGNVIVTLTADAPDASVQFYNWIQHEDAGTVTLDTLVCPSADSSLDSCSRDFGPAGVTGIFIQDTGGEFDALTENNASHEGDGPYVWADLPSASYAMDTSGLSAPDGYEIAGVVLTPDGADISGGFELNSDVSIANIVVVLTAVAPEEEIPTEVPVTDSDNDGLTDVDEASAGTDPSNPDSDGDCHADGAEVAAGTDPLDSSSLPDGDCDFVSDTEEG